MDCCISFIILLYMFQVSSPGIFLHESLLYLRGCYCTFISSKDRLLFTTFPNCYNIVFIMRFSIILAIIAPLVAATPVPVSEPSSVTNPIAGLIRPLTSTSSGLSTILDAIPDVILDSVVLGEVASSVQSKHTDFHSGSIY